MRWKNSGPAGRHLRRGVSLALLVAALESGCSREFYREWANQDASEAVFEKSRDPRWRLDAFTIEPPAMSRFADPYDPEFPPAPPDDPASEALSPVPQWPDHRLITPAEGTGYLDMMDGWMQEREAYQREMVQERAASEAGRPGAGGGKPVQAVPPRPPQTPSPFAPGTGGGWPASGPTGMSSPAVSPGAPGLAGSAPSGIRAPSGPSDGSAPAKLTSARKPRENSGTGLQASTPIPRADERSEGKKASLPPPRSASSFALGQSRSISRSKDDAVQRALAPADARLDSSGRVRSEPGAGPGQVPPGEAGLPPQPLIPTDTEASERQKAEQIRRQAKQIGPPGPGRTFTPEQAAELSSVLIPQLPPLNINAYTGLPANARPYVITMQQAFTLALINSRFYQLQLENLYSAALAVTLQRFQFEPQFYAGMSPITPPLGRGFPGVSPINQFLYQTRSAPGGQVSSLTLGEIAGVGKLFNSGAQLLMGFANQVVFNFVGKNPIQPTVQSSLPLTFFQPLLRGAGRAVTLEPLTQAERNLLYQTRIFAQFRQQFIVVTLTGGTISQPGIGFNLQGFSTSGNTDPTLGFIPMAVNYGNVIIDRRNVAYFEQLAALYAQLIEGESSGLSQLQVDQVKSNLLLARSTLISDILTLRNAIDSFKQQLGLPPDTPMVPDLSLVQPFIDVYEAIDEWQRGANRKIEDIDKLLKGLPQLEDIILDGHSVLGMYKNSTTFDQEEELEATLQAAVRIALEYRMDLMNTRAQLYDAWRKIRVAANALKGFLNVTLTNQVFTPPTTTNPFGFFSQSHQFSLVLNAELPLIRVAERNEFRGAIIAYEQARRALMSQEDFIKNQLRSDIRTMQQTYIQYRINIAQLALNIRLKDQAFEQIVAPPQVATGQSLAQTANAAAQTTNLIGFQRQLITSEQAVINAYQAYEAARLTVYRDIGTLPYDEWEAFSELFPSEYRGPALGSGTSKSKFAATGASQTAKAISR